MTTLQVNEWSRIHSKHITKLWNWKLTVTAKDAMEQDCVGKGIGKYIRKKEEDYGGYAIGKIKMMQNNF